ncbi:hydroxypyruvate isomerase family protein [Nisaea acidiphila]|uniref:Hydroxypyruvate isomerase family protein n=1 Tax=Nisaea acidiphila TaxID=1862145 RepID=A0A9J7APL7_9PROT|nr:2-oxo-tetronate isomerase [Nisaea acidiphila]UUX48292.1 hydroxypyruvate isomerase family protein [Nisaea acidiphila]
MPKLAANLSMMFQELPFLDRFKAAAEAGFRGVEFLFPYDFPAGEIRAKLEDAGLTQALFNLPPGDWDAGDRGFAAIPGRQDAFLAALEKALDYADALDCPRLHVMSGMVPDGVSREACTETLIANLKQAAPIAGKRGKTLILEPINNRDMPPYFLNYQDQALSIIDAVGENNVRLQFDLYHCQIMEGDLAVHLKDNLAAIEHIQIAGVPERHEPDIGEINYPYLFRLMDDLGYEGWVGCEYRPQAGTVEGLGWMKEWTE